jgi:hypothetical protein
MWALGATLSVAVVLAGAYVGRHIVSSRVQAAAHVNAPAIAPAVVVREARPEAGAAFAVPIGTSTRMVLVASSAERTCPLVGTCGPVPPLDGVQVVDVASGSVLASHALDGPAQQALAVTADPQLGLVALVTPHMVATYSAATLNPVGSLPLPNGMVADQASGAALSANGTLWLAARQGGQFVLLGIDERTGQLRADVALAPATSVDGPLYDAQAGGLLVLEREGSTAEVVAFSAATGAPERHAAVPAGARLGPLNPTTDELYLFGLDGTTYRLGLQGGGSASDPAAVPALFGARALGWDPASEQQYVADAAGVRIVDTRTRTTLAALPISVQSPPDQPLVPVEMGGERDVAVLGEHGTLVVMRSSPPAATLTGDTAVLFARAALVQLVRQDAGNPTPQDPLFLTADMFTPGPGLRADVPFMVRDPDVGWQSASPGTAGIAVAASTGGAFAVTFTITWTQHHFTHRHVSVLRVAPTGAVTMESDTGDALP